MADERMRELFLSGKTTDRTYRGETLGKLYADVRAKKNDIVGCLAAIWAGLPRSALSFTRQ